MDPLEVLRAEVPTLDLSDVRTIDEGWDSLVLEVGATWIFRFPRRVEVEEAVEREVAFLPELAPTLPAAVPGFEVVGRRGVPFVGYRKLEGSPARSGIDERTGEDLGRFLGALHRFPVERALALGVPYEPQRAWRGRYERLFADLRRRAFPLLDASERARAEELFAGADDLDFEPVPIHADLGPDHVLCRDSRLVGVIDWSDARVGDAALDLAWCLHGTPEPFAKAVTRAYGADDDVRRRSLFYHRVGPWHEVVYGLDSGEQRFVRSGLEGVRARLPG